MGVGIFTSPKHFWMSRRMTAGTAARPPWLSCGALFLVWVYGDSSQCCRSYRVPCHRSDSPD